MITNMQKNVISFGKANEALCYSPESGLFTWKERSDVPPKWNGRYAGKLAGTIEKNGYVRIMIEGKRFLAHRLAFLLMNGEMPTYYVDHIDGCRSNNVWANLREATLSQNNSNSKMQSNNTSGVKGVSWRKDREKWTATIKANKNYIHIGYFDNIDEAEQAYATAAANFHKEFANNGFGTITAIRALKETP